MSLDLVRNYTHPSISTALEGFSPARIPVPDSSFLGEINQVVPTQATIGKSYAAHFSIQQLSTTDLKRHTKGLIQSFQRA